MGKTEILICVKMYSSTIKFVASYKTFQLVNISKTKIVLNNLLMTFNKKT